MRFVPIKSAEQLDLQALHRIRSRLVGHRTAVINQLGGFLLECGVIVPQGPAMLRKILPSVLAQRTDVLSPRMIRLIEELSDDWRRLDDRVDAVTNEVQACAPYSSSGLARSVCRLPVQQPLEVRSCASIISVLLQKQAAPGSSPSNLAKASNNAVARDFRIARAFHRSS